MSYMKNRIILLKRLKNYNISGYDVLFIFIVSNVITLITGVRAQGGVGGTGVLSVWTSDGENADLTEIENPDFRITEIWRLL